MWVEFFIATAFVLAILYIPGYLLARCLLPDRFAALLCSPLVSIAGYVLLGIAYDGIDTSVPWFALVLPVFLVGAVLFFPVFRFRNAPDSIDERFRWVSLGCYFLVGVAVMTFFYVRCLDGAESFAQIFDNAAHLNMIRAFSDSGHYSILHATEYLSGTTLGGSPVAESRFTFYPAAWHIVAALACSALSLPAAIAENAANYAFAGFVFPASVCLLLHSFFRGSKRTILCGAVCCLAFEAFPWGLMMFGPLYSNMMAYCVLPLVLYCVCSLFSFRRGQMVKFGIMVVIGGIALGASQPNSIFTAIVLILPYCTYRIYRFTLDGTKSQTKAVIASAVLVVMFAVGWLALWRSPSFSAVVSYPWPAFTSKHQSVVNVLVLSLRDAPAQPLLGLVVLFGVAYTFFARRLRWLVWAYGFAVLMYCVAASTDGTLKSLLCGFWYNDSYRLAAVLALSAIPLSALGLSATIGAFNRCLMRLDTNNAKRSLVLPAAVVVLAFVAFTFSPSYVISGVGTVETAFSRVTGGLDWLASPEERKYTIEESSFVKRAKEIVDQDPGVVVNFPFDGSVFAYGADGLDTYYRTFYSFGGASETEDSKLLRTSFDRVATDQDVFEAAVREGVKYVLLLDDGGGSQSIHEDLYSDKDRDDWKGLLDVTPETQGFELVLSQDDMRLYKVKDPQ